MRLSHQEDFTAGPSSYRNTAGLPALELDQYEQDTQSKLSASHMGPSHNSIISVFGPRNHMAIHSSLN